MPEVYAAVDIGTNTILMLIAEVDNREIRSIITDEHRIARLGEGVDSTGNIQLPAIDRATNILKDYSAICRQNNVSRIRIVGTSALRDATNKEYVISELEKYIGAEIEVITGEEEALLSFTGTVENTSRSMVIDIGGGSTEYIVGRNDYIEQRMSLRIGAVRLTERFFLHHPPSEKEVSDLRNFLREEFGKKLTHLEDISLYAVAGTPTTIASVVLGLTKHSSESTNGYILSRENIKNVLETFLSNDLSYLTETLHIHPKRADVITAGTIILQESLKALGQEECIVSTKGLRYGILKSMLNKK